MDTPLKKYSFKRILKTNGGIVINIKVMDMSKLLEVKKSKTIAKIRLIRSKVEPKSLEMPSFLPLILISLLTFFSIIPRNYKFI